MSAGTLLALRRPALIGHRGHGQGPSENTLASIAAAADAGADGVEIDVRSTNDGAVVVLHDPTLGRLSQGRDPRVVAALSLEELKRAALSAGEELATLDEVLELTAERALGLNVELKRDLPDRRGLVERVARVLAARREPDRLWVSSFDPVMLAHVARVTAPLPRALLVHPRGWRRHLAALARPIGMNAIHPHHSLVDERRVARWHRRGLLVFVWTVNDKAVARRLLDAGVDGIITDDPKAMRTLFDERAVTRTKRTRVEHPPVRPA